MTTNRRRHVLQINGKTFRLNDKLFNLLAKKIRALGSSGMRRLGDNGSNARTRFEQTVVQQLRDHLMRRVRIDLEFT